MVGPSLLSTRTAAQCWLRIVSVRARHCSATIPSKAICQSPCGIWQSREHLPHISAVSQTVGVSPLRHPTDKASFPLLALQKLVPSGLPWVSMYWIFSGVIILMLVTLATSRFPKVNRTEEEQAGTASMYSHLLRKPAVLLFFVSVFMYVGSEQGTADWISQFLSQYHGYDPHTTGATAVAWFWGLMTAGCGLGMLLLKLFDSRKVLLVFSLGAIASLTVALFGPGTAAQLAFPLTGFFASVMWPIIISLGLNSVAEYHGPLAGILCAGITGGAIVPLVVGRIGDAFGLRDGMLFLYITFGWILCVPFWAKPLIANETLRNKKAQ